MRSATSSSRSARPASVYPAAAFVHWARGATLELNLEPSAGATDFAESRQGPATRLVPRWVDELLG